MSSKITSNAVYRKTANDIGADSFGSASQAEASAKSYSEIYTSDFYKDRGLPSILTGASTRYYVPMESKINTLSQSLQEENKAILSSGASIGSFGIYGGDLNILEGYDRYCKIDIPISESNYNNDDDYYQGSSVGSLSFWYNHNLINDVATGYDNNERVLACLYGFGQVTNIDDLDFVLILTSYVDYQRNIVLGLYAWSEVLASEIINKKINTGIKHNVYNNIIINFDTFSSDEIQLSLFLNSVNISGLDTYYDFTGVGATFSRFEYLTLGCYEKSTNMQTYIRTTRGFDVVAFDFDELRLFSKPLEQKQIDSIYHNPMIDNMLSAFLIKNYNRYIEGTEDESTLSPFDKGDLYYKTDTDELFIKTFDGIKNYNRYIEGTEDESTLSPFNKGDLYYKTDTDELFIKTFDGIKKITIT